MSELLGRLGPLLGGLAGGTEPFSLPAARNTANEHTEPAHTPTTIGPHLKGAGGNGSSDLYNRMPMATMDTIGNTPCVTS